MLRVSPVGLHSAINEECPLGCELTLTHAEETVSPSALTTSVGSPDSVFVVFLFFAISLSIFTHPNDLIFIAFYDDDDDDDDSHIVLFWGAGVILLYFTINEFLNKKQ